MIGTACDKKLGGLRSPKASFEKWGGAQA